MLRDRVPSWALEVCCPRGIESPEPPFLFWRQPGAMFRGDRRSPGAPIALVPLGYRVTTNPQPLPYYLYEGMYTLPRVYPMAIDVAEAN